MKQKSAEPDVEKIGFDDHFLERNFFSAASGGGAPVDASLPLTVGRGISPF